MWRKNEVYDEWQQIIGGYCQSSIWNREGFGCGRKDGDVLSCQDNQICMCLVLQARNVYDDGCLGIFYKIKQHEHWSSAAFCVERSEFREEA